MAKRAVILGAGPAGLVTAWQLSQAGWTVDVYERLDRVGGMCRTWPWGDFLVDTGPHIFHTPDPDLARLWDEKFGDLLLHDEFWCKNVKGDAFDEYWDYPLSWESISRYPKKLKETILRELAERQPEAKARARNYTQYMEAEVGPTLRRLFFEKYPFKIWGIPTDEMTPDWAPRRIEFRQKVTPFYHNQWNAAGKFGSGRILERMAEWITALGGRIHLNTEVKGLTTEGNRLSAVLFSKMPSCEIAPDDVVVSTLPLPRLAGFLGYESTLAFRGTCSVHLECAKPFVLPEGIHWLYYDAEEILFHRVTEGKKIASDAAPADRTCLTVEIAFSPGDEIHTHDPASLVERVAEQIVRVGLAARDEIREGMVHMEEAVYPIQNPGYQEELARTRAVVERFEQLYSVGAGGEFLYGDCQILFHKAMDLAAMLDGRDSTFAQTLRQTPRVDLHAHVALGGHTVGPGKTAYIIAEAGLNHNGSPAVARRLVDAARDAGCHAIKFQTFRPGGRISGKVKTVRYAEQIIGLEENLAEMFDRLAMSFDDQRELFAYARDQGLEIFSTPFDAESADFLASLDVGQYKIASMDLVNLPLIDHVASKGRPVILSTGMSTLGQIEEAVETVRRAGNADLVLLHCNSTYPAPPDEMNLRVIDTLRSAFGVPVGLSDHTFGLFVSHTALARGADVIERHFTLDRMMEGPDHILSSEPSEMTELVRLARRVPVVLGDGIKRIRSGEYDTINSQRKSLYAATDIAQGQTLTADMIAVKGPGGGLLPRYLPLVVGRTARRDIEADHPIQWDSI